MPAVASVAPLALKGDRAGIWAPQVGRNGHPGADLRAPKRAGVRPRVHLKPGLTARLVTGMGPESEPQAELADSQLPASDEIPVDGMLTCPIGQVITGREVSRQAEKTLLHHSMTQMRQEPMQYTHGQPARRPRGWWDEFRQTEEADQQNPQSS